MLRFGVYQETLALAAQVGKIMSYRDPLVTGQIYHVYNRGIDHRPTFLTKRQFSRFGQTMWYYANGALPLSLSKFNGVGIEQREHILAIRAQSAPLVSVLAYCTMPNHFHLLVRQNVEGGISTYLSLLQNSYTRYFNGSEQRTGSLFLNRFKYVRIETEAQLLHVSRYIHLNPYASFVVATEAELLRYSWSSLPAYAAETKGLVDVSSILNLFQSRKSYIDFVLDRAAYQRNLKSIEHLAIDSRIDALSEIT